MSTNLKSYNDFLIDKKTLNLNKNYILYEESKDFLITTKYEKCRLNKNYRCNCAFYMRVNDNIPKYAFIDFCLGNSNSTHELKYFDNGLINNDVLTTGDFPHINCNYTIVNETDENEWKKVQQYKQYFKCAILANSECKTFLV